MSAKGVAKSRRLWLVVLILGVVLVVTVVAVRAVGRGASAVNKPAPPAISDRDRSLSTQAKSASVSTRCLDALFAVESAGHALLDETEFRCPGSSGFSPDSEQHWGATCWDTALCPGRSYIAINPSVIGSSDERLRYVIAHEICHVNRHARTGEAGSEPEADACAAAAGFPRV